MLLETKSFNKIFTKEHELQILSQTKLSQFQSVLGTLYGYIEATFSALGSPGPCLYRLVSRRTQSWLTRGLYLHNCTQTLIQMNKQVWQN